MHEIPQSRIKPQQTQQTNVCIIIIKGCVHYCYCTLGGGRGKHNISSAYSLSRPLELTFPRQMWETTITIILMNMVIMTYALIIIMLICDI